MSHNTAECRGDNCRWLCLRSVGSISVNCIRLSRFVGAEIYQPSLWVFLSPFLFLKLVEFVATSAVLTRSVIKCVSR